jgi:hypothetical protein
VLTALAVPGPATAQSLLVAGAMLVLLLLVVVPCALAKGSRPIAPRSSTSCPTSQGLSR